MSTSGEGIENLSTLQRRELLDEMLREKERRARRFPLSSAQYRMWLLDQLAADRSGYNQLLPLLIAGPLDSACLQASIAALVKRHEPLRTTFAAESGKPYQVIGAARPPSLEVDDLTALEAGERDGRVLELASVERAKEFDLSRDLLLRVRLLRCSPREHVLLLTTHHIAFDGWSREVLIRELLTLYDAARRGVPPSLPHLEVQYADFAVWQNEWLGSPAYRQQLTYWQERLRDLQPLDLATDFRRPAVQSFGGAEQSKVIGRSIWEGVHSLCRVGGVTPFMVLFTAFAAVLHRHTGQDDIVIGSPVANRNRSQLEGLVGCFVNNLVLRTDVSSEPTFRQLLMRVRECALDAYEHQDLPFETLVKVLEPQRDQSRNPLFQVMFALQGTDSRVVRSDELRFRVMQIHVETTRFDLECYLIPGDDTLTLRMVYCTALFEGPTIERLLIHFERMLERGVSAPDERISAIDILGTAERRRLLELSTGRVSATTAETTLLSRFHAVARSNPRGLALGQGGRSMTYAQLDGASNRLANRLRAVGVTVDSPVGVLLDRSVEMVVAWLAVLKSGAAYLPLDPTYPAARLQYMLRDSLAVALVTDRTWSERVPEFSGYRIRIDDDAAPGAGDDRSPEVVPAPRDLAYLIYTSGSTGLPKGVAVEHRALDNLVAWHCREYAISPHDRATQLAGLGFDACVWEVWPYLAAGASVHLVDEDTRQSPGALWQWLVELGITITFVPTPMAEGMLREAVPPGIRLRAMLTGGDRLHGGGLPVQLPFRLVNHYGPTENAVVSTWADVDLASASQSEPVIGWAIDNVHAYVLDARMQLVPVGVSGELYLGGASLARGYWERDDLTEQRFVADPFRRGPRARLYRSGDLVRRRNDGALEFIGRADQQVKLRGHRIELGEIESVLNAHPAVVQAVVTCRGEGASARGLAAYVVKAAPGLSLPALRDDLRKQLPSYMVPTAWVELDNLPLTANGKVDRDALAEAGHGASEWETFAEPRTDVEKDVAGIWRELLKLERVGLDDNFFEIGGHSLAASQMVSRIREVFQVDLALGRVFMNPTVAGLAHEIQISTLADSSDDRRNGFEEFRL